MKERNINRFIISLLINSEKQNKMSVVILTIDTGFKEDEPLEITRDVPIMKNAEKLALILLKYILADETNCVDSGRLFPEAFSFKVREGARKASGRGG